MLQLKQTLHNTYTRISSIISTIRTDLQSRGVVALSSPLVASLGILLYCLTLLTSIVLLITAIFTLNLLLLIAQILMRLGEQLMSIAKGAWNVLCTLCRWAVGAKSTTSMSKKSQTSAWKKDGDLPQDYTLASSEMPGELKNYKNEQHRKAMKARIIDEDAIRKAGF